MWITRYWLTLLALLLLFVFGFSDQQCIRFFVKITTLADSLLSAKLPVINQYRGHYILGACIAAVSCAAVALFFRQSLRLWLWLTVAYKVLATLALTLFIYKTHFSPPLQRIWQDFYEVMISPLPMLVLAVYFYLSKNAVKYT